MLTTESGTSRFRNVFGHRCRTGGPVYVADDSTAVTTTSPSRVAR